MDDFVEVRLKKYDSWLEKGQIAVYPPWVDAVVRVIVHYHENVSRRSV
jgi:hypothetical protein